MDISARGSSAGRRCGTRTTIVWLILSVGAAFCPQLARASGGKVTSTLSISPNSSVVAGTAVTLTATVMNSGIPVTKGLIVFCDANAAHCEDGAILGTAQLTGSGSATFRLVPGVGSYSIQAVFQGSVTSSPQPLTVSGISSYPSATTIVASGTAGNYTLTGTVSAFGRQAPAGTVSFLDTRSSNSAVGSAALNPASLASKMITSPGSPTGVGAQPDLVAEGDFNNDGIDDLAVANSGESTISVLLGKGGGTFQPQVKFTTGKSPHAIAVGDFNGDGNLDVVVANGDDNTLSLLLGKGDGTFQAQATYATGNSPLGIAVADFNLDGNADVVVANAADNTISILLGNGDGTLQPQVGYPAGSLPHGIAVADFNGDGIPDLAVASSSDNSLSVLLGNGDGTFPSAVVFPVGNAPSYTAAVDLNGDGFPDLVSANYKDNTISVLLGNGDGTFQTQVTYAAGSGAYILASGDFNADGKADLAVTNFKANTVSVYLGNGDGTLQPQVVYPVGHGASGVVSGDFNGDGLPDLALANYTDRTVSVLPAGFTETAVATGVSVLGRGTHNVLASYPGDTIRAASKSSSVPLTAPTFTVKAPQTPVTVTPGGSAKFALTVAPAGGTFSGVVTMTASGLPPGATASFVPATVIPGSTGQSTVMTIQTSIQTSNLTAMPNSQFLLASISLAAGMSLMGRRRKLVRKQLSLLFAFAMLAGGTLMMTGCQGLTTAKAQSQSYGITVSGASGSVRSSTTVTIVVQ
jgi:hypothetical protein